MKDRFSKRWRVASRLSPVVIALLFVSLLVGSSVLRGADRKMVWVRVDNKYIQTYKEHLGQWIQPGKTKISLLAEEMGTTVDEIRQINGSDLNPSSYIFIPMSEEHYYGYLREGKGRRIIQIDPRKFLWPVEQPSYSSRFGKRFNSFHEGLDLACPRMTIVVAAMEGTVVQAGWFGGLGNAVSIEHPNGIHTWYGHNTSVLVKVGDKVQRGQAISLSGSTGFSTGPHVHFEVRYMEVAMNPEDFLPYGFTRPDMVLRENLPENDSETQTQTVGFVKESTILHPAVTTFAAGDDKTDIP